MVMGIRCLYPDPYGLYTGYISTELEDENQTEEAVAGIIGPGDAENLPEPFAEFSGAESDNQDEICVFSDSDSEEFDSDSNFSEEYESDEEYYSNEE
jgi:hypothetical protein